MSIDDDFFDLENYIEEDESRDSTAMKAILDRILDYVNGVEAAMTELRAQNDALKKVVTIKGAIK